MKKRIKRKIAKAFIKSCNGYVPRPYPYSVKQTLASLTEIDRVHRLYEYNYNKNKQ